MTVYILKYSTDYGDEGHVREPFTSKTEAVKVFNKYKKIAKEDERDAMDASRRYHIHQDDKPDDFITKWTIKTTADLVEMIKRI